MIPLVEKQEDWHLLRSGVFAYLNAEGALADRIAGLLWRLHRVVRFESESISRSLEDVPGDWHAQQEMFKRPVPEEPTREGVAEMDEMLMARLLPEEETLDRVMRYEARLHRFLLQTMHQFLILKGLRESGRTRWGLPETDPPWPTGHDVGRRPPSSRLLPAPK